MLIVPAASRGARGHGFPSHLAKLVAERWHTMVLGPNYVVPALPSLKLLVSLLETVYLASLETEEGRPLHFTVYCILSGTNAVRHYSDFPIDTWKFDKAREFSVQELRRLSSATNIDSVGILASFPSRAKGSILIEGLINVGSSWESARRGFSYRYEAPPLALTIRADGPGRLSVYQGQFLVATLSSGEVLPSKTGSNFDLIGIHSFLREGVNSLSANITSPEHEELRDWADFEWLAYLNTVLAIVNTIQHKGHGGALIFARAASQIWQPPDNLLRVKYRMADNFLLREKFIAFMDERHRFGDLLTLREANTENAPTDESIGLVAGRLTDASQRLASTAAFIGGLSGVDGAIVLTNAFEVIGFGAEILLDKAPQAQIREVIGSPMLKEHKELDSEQFGMRHRSAMRLCAASDGIAVFVISQDGGASLVWKDGTEVFFKKGVNTVNANMVLA